MCLLCDNCRAGNVGSMRELNHWTLEAFHCSVTKYALTAVITMRLCLQQLEPLVVHIGPALPVLLRSQRSFSPRIKIFVHSALSSYIKIATSTMINIFILLAAFYSVYFFWGAIWNIYCHPLHKIPGPKLWIAFPIFRHISLVRGQLEADIKAFHGKYGKVVRFSTEEVSFITAQAWREIYNDFPKAELSTNVPLGINNANDENHRRYRKALAHSFSTKALTTQEPVLIEYTEKLINRMKGFSESQRPADMVKWYNSTTFDLIGDLAFGVSFGNLDTDGYHFWVSNVFQAVRGIVMGTIKDAYPVLFKLFSFAFGLNRFSEARARQLEYSSSTMQKRLAREKPRDLVDFMDGFLQSKDNITVEEMEANANLLIIAGSDTTATLLSGTTYYLLRTPRALEKATQEVRSAFKSESEINFLNTTARLPYMIACLNEGMRMYPPVPSVLQRVAVSSKPIEISGYYISQGVSQCHPSRI